LKEKLKDDPQKLNQAMWQLQREYGVNPMGGCLPTLAQMPIFFGFYSMLGTAVELRGSSFLWIKDLSVPDTVAHVLGFPLNPLPLIMAATMFWQMKITPKTGDQQQQKIFMFMPFIFIIFCYNFASALALYWTVQNLLSVLQTYLTRHRPLPALTKKNTGEKPAKAQVVGPSPKKKALR
jgi:YidC/Oxa1 family membrane protein insertase